MPADADLPGRRSRESKANTREAHRLRIEVCGNRSPIHDDHGMRSGGCRKDKSEANGLRQTADDFQRLVKTFASPCEINVGMMKCGFLPRGWKARTDC